jgi:hypothetical protein
MVATSITYYQSLLDAAGTNYPQAHKNTSDPSPYLISTSNLTEDAAGGIAFITQVNNTRGWLIYWGVGGPPPGASTDGPWMLGQTLNTISTLYTYALYPAPYPCFLEGSKILCMVEGKEEYRPVETLRNGTLVKTSRDGFKPVAMIGHSKIYNPSNTSRSTNRLYRCPIKNYPELTEDLIITGQHSILVDTLTEEQRKLTLEHMGDIYVTDKKYRLIAAVDERAEPYTTEGIFTIWHLALENENYYMNYGIYANGLLVETMSLRYLKELSGMTLV